MSSHREAPEISKDPAADNTDVYAFISPDAPDTVTLIANFNPFEIPYGGPNFHEFAPEVLYTINISNAGKSQADITYQFTFHTTIRNPNTFLYNTGPIASLTDPNFNRPQTYTVKKVVRASNGSLTTTTLGTGLTVPPCNVGERSTPNYQANLGAPAVHSLGTGRKVFCGPRSDPFFADLGSIFDLAGLRPLNPAHLIPLPVMQAMNGLQGVNVHTIALQVPITELALGGHRPTDKTSSSSVIGVWSSTYRARGLVYDQSTLSYKPYGGFAQVSRLGNPLFNEVINPMSVKDKWNAVAPYNDSNFAKYVNHPELAGLLPVLYPGVFPNLKAYTKTRADLNAILLTGIPAAVLGGALTTYTGPVQADMVRLNLAVPPTAAGSVNNLGVVAGDVAGFPNGRRVADDVTTIELRAVAGLTIPLVDPTYTVDAILKTDELRDGTSYGKSYQGTKAPNGPLLTTFPYVGAPANGYDTAPPTVIPAS